MAASSRRNAFFKGHGLGNDYLVVDPARLDFRLTRRAVRALCDRHEGVGADGVLALAPPGRADFGVRVLNPDGSEAERSGNGLRIFALYLAATGRTRRARFTVGTRAGPVGVELLPGRRTGEARVRVAMGRASFRPADLPCTLDAPELVHEPIRAGGRALRFTGVSVGNPHCVVFRPRGRRWRREDLLEVGPELERHDLFPRRCNVQLAVPTGARSLDILVFERGAGETRASGTSACAAAAAAVRRGLVKSPVTVRAPGGRLRVEVGRAFDVVLDGPVREVARGVLSDAFAAGLR